MRLIEMPGVGGQWKRITAHFLRKIDYADYTFAYTEEGNYYQWAKANEAKLPSPMSEQEWDRFYGVEGAAVVVAVFEAGDILTRAENVARAVVPNSKVTEVGGSQQRVIGRGRVSAPDKEEPSSEKDEVKDPDTEDEEVPNEQGLEVTMGTSRRESSDRKPIYAANVETVDGMALVKLGDFGPLTQDNLIAIDEDTYDLILKALTDLDDESSLILDSKGELHNVGRS